MKKLKSWFTTKRQLVKREKLLREVERVAFDYRESNVYDKYTKILTILVNGKE